jgi:hypothetical protein
MYTKTRRAFSITLLAVLLCSSFINIVTPPTAHAAVSGTPSEQLTRWFYYRGMWSCLSSGDREAELMQVITSYVGDTRSVIPLDDKKAYESYASTKAPYKYQPDRVNDLDDGRGPDGSM